MRKKNYYFKKCLVCGKKFLTSDSRRKFCNELHKKIYRAEYKHEWYERTKGGVKKTKKLHARNTKSNRNLSDTILNDIDHDVLKDLGMLDQD